MIIPVDKLPSNFKPYPYKSFKMRAISVQESIDLGTHPKFVDIGELIQKLSDNTIDGSKLAPCDAKFLLSMLSFHAYPKQSWLLDLKCPHCKHSHKRSVTIKDFPAVPTFEDSDPYPLMIDDGTHKWELGYASLADTDVMVEALRKAQEEGTAVDKRSIDFLIPYIKKVDGSEEGIRDKLLGLEDFGVLDLMFRAVEHYFVDDNTYSEFKCPKCGKMYSVKMSAVEVAQFVPFPDEEAASRYKINFRL